MCARGAAAWVAALAGFRGEVTLRVRGLVPGVCLAHRKGWGGQFCAQVSAVGSNVSAAPQFLKSAPDTISPFPDRLKVTTDDHHGGEATP